MTKDQPEIKILIQPTNRMRFRYGSEKGSHGVLTGSQDKKSFPTVKLENYIIEEKPVFIRASLYTNDKEPRLHVHRFKGPQCDDGMCILQVDKESMIAIFQNLSIEFVGKKEVTKVLYERKFRLTNVPSNQYPSAGSYDPSMWDSAKKEANKMNLNVVRICFEAVVQDPHNRTWHSLGQKVFSEPISNQKATETGELKIVRMDKCSGSCAGGDEIFLLCDKVNKKDIQIQFYEEKNGEITWQDWGQFTEADVHYQVAIVFQTPPYHQDISESVEVLIRLFRRSDQETSEPRQFRYQPKEQDKEGVETKRRKVAYSSGYRPTEGMSGFKTSPSSPYSTSSMSSGEFGSQKKNESGGMETTFTEQQVPDELFELLHLLSTEISESSNPSVDVLEEPCYAFEASEQNNPLVDTSRDPLLASTSSMWQPEIEMQNRKRQPRFPTQIGNLYSDSICEQTGLQATMAKLTIRENSSNPDVKTNQPANNEEYQPTVKSESYRLKSYEQSTAVIEKELLSKLRLLIDVYVYKFGPRVLTELQKYAKQGKVLSILLALQSTCLLKGNKDGDNALHLALIHEHENTEILLKLIEVMKNAQGDAINNSNNAHQTPLHLAVVCRKPLYVLHLLSAGANPNLKDKNGDTAIHIAASSGETDCLKILLSSKKFRETIKLNDLNYSGKAPLHLAVEKNHQAAVELLCEAGADVNIADGKSGKAPLHYATRSATIASILLKQHKIQVNLQDYGGNTPLHLACAHGAEDIVLQLMQNKANPLIKTHSHDANEVCSDADEVVVEEGKTAYDYADSNEKIIAILNRKNDNLSLPSVDASNPENSYAQTERRNNVLSDKCDQIDQKQDLKAILNPATKKEIEEKHGESLLHQCDSGYESREIQFLDNSQLKELCQLLDPPSHRWEQLAEYLVDKKHLKYLRSKKSPTKTMLRLYKGTIEEFVRIVEISGFSDVLKLLQSYTVNKIAQES